MILAYLLGSLLLIGPALTARVLKTEHLSWQRFTLALPPLASASVILGLSMFTVTHLKAEHLWLGWLPYFRVGLLTAGCLGSLWLSYQLVLHPKGASEAMLRCPTQKWQKPIAGLAMLIPVSLMAVVWSLVFFIW